jgi:protein phosphatase
MTNIIKIPELSLVMLIGASGSGKSSFARKHFKATEVISSDYCRGLVSDDENDQSATKDAFEVLNFIAQKRLSAGKLTVIDATNVQLDARKSLIDLARKYHVLPIAIVLNIPKAICHERNGDRANRQFGKHVVENQAAQLEKSLSKIKKEGISQCYILNSVTEVENVKIERKVLWNNLKHEKGPFDIIGDIHGCFDELYQLLIKLGYQIDYQDKYLVAHPGMRKIIFVGDLVDRGPKTPQVLKIVMDIVESGAGFCVVGNHDDKLKRKLQGRDVKIAHGLLESLEQLEGESQEFKEKAINFLDKLISHYVFDEGKLAVAHAGLKAHYIGRGSPRIRDFCMYGETTGEIDEFGLPARHNWASDYRGSSMIVYGHTPVPVPVWLNNTINVDTACVFGGKLTALRYPEKELVSVDAKEIYAKALRPIDTNTRGSDDLLDIEDIYGKKIISTSLHNNITIRAEQSSLALELMSRFAIDPKWLIYLPPTMSPSETSSEELLLEHPKEALDYYRNRNVAKVICQEKHMGSRAIIIVCKDTQSANETFGINSEEIGVCYTRTGRSFFSDKKLEQEILKLIAASVTKANLWEELNTGWLCLDIEIMPWSAKAHSLIKEQYAAVGVSATAGLTEAISQMEQVDPSVVGVKDLIDKFKLRQNNISKYQNAYKNYCWEVNSISDYKIAPFHLLAHENSLNMTKDHLWHMNIIGKLCDASPELLKKTNYKIIDTSNMDACLEVINWWEEITSNGGEGMVVKPLEFTSVGNKGLIQPGIKCRGREYLRIIYGAEYTTSENIKLLKNRRLDKKRSLALREYALGYEALSRFVAKEPLYKVHEAVFGVLALMSDPVDPRL